MTVGSVLATAVARVLDRSEAVITRPCVYRAADGLYHQRHRRALLQPHSLVRDESPSAAPLTATMLASGSPTTQFEGCWRPSRCVAPGPAEGFLRYPERLPRVGQCHVRAQRMRNGQSKM